jgi:hypothetical protein
MSKNDHERVDRGEMTFPGRWVGGVAMIIGPLMLLTGVVLRLPFHFFFPQQLVAFAEHPTLIKTGYSAFIAGNVLMWPAIMEIARRISTKRPYWALWGGCFVIFGLFARTFHAGVDHMAFQLVRELGVESATRVVADSYGAYHIFSALNPAIMLGWIILAIGAYRSNTLNLLRSVALGLMSALPLGVLKGSTTLSVVATVGLCIALIPLGFHTLRAGPTPSWPKALSWSIGVVLIVAVFIFVGRQG